MLLLSPVWAALGDAGPGAPRPEGHLFTPCSCGVLWAGTSARFLWLCECGHPQALRMKRPRHQAAFSKCLSWIDTSPRAQGARFLGGWALAHTGGQMWKCPLERPAMGQEEQGPFLLQAGFTSQAALLWTGAGVAVPRAGQHRSDEGAFPGARSSHAMHLARATQKAVARAAWPRPAAHSRQDEGKE